jgi:hypothetical protein
MEKPFTGTSNSLCETQSMPRTSLKPCNCVTSGQMGLSNLSIGTLTGKHCKEPKQIDRCNMVKLCHNVSPTGSMVGMYGQGLTGYWALCKTPNSTKTTAISYNAPIIQGPKGTIHFFRPSNNLCSKISTLFNIILAQVDPWHLVKVH